MLLFPRFTYLMRGVKSISSLVLLLHEITFDIGPFAAITGVFLAVMGYALALLSPRNGSGLSHSTDGFIVSVYLTLLGDFDRDEDANGFQVMVFFLFSAVSNIVLLNALIAIISKSYEIAQVSAPISLWPLSSVPDSSPNAHQYPPVVFPHLRPIPSGARRRTALAAACLRHPRGPGADRQHERRAWKGGTRTPRPLLSRVSARYDRALENLLRLPLSALECLWSASGVQVGARAQEEECHERGQQRGERGES